MKIAIRLTVKWSDVLIPFFEGLDRSVVYQHDADDEISRTHIHALVETSVSTDTLKNRIIKIIGKLPKTDWAFTQKIKHNPVEDRFITYMSKGKLDPVYLKGFTQDTCDKYKAHWKCKDTPPVALKNSNSVTALDIAIELKKYIMTEIWDGDDPEGRKPFQLDNMNHRWIVNKCIELHNKYGKTYMIHSLLRVIQTAWGLCDANSRWKDRIITATVKQLDSSISNI